MTEANAFDDSQASGHSNDLFDREEEGENNQLQQILDELKQLRKEVASMRNSMKNSPSGTFNIEKCGFKKHLNVVLKRNFSVNPWVQTDDEFKSMVQKYISEDGFGGDLGAIRTVVAHATTKFTEFRNQLRRKILAKIDEIKRLSLQSVCRLLFEPYTPIGDETLSTKRIHHTLIIRSYLHRSNYLETRPWCWQSYKDFFNSIIEDQRPNKWEILQDKDSKRIQRLSRE